MNPIMKINWSILPQRIRLALALERRILRTPACGWTYLFEQWRALLLNRRQMRFLGHTFSFEGRLAPFLIFDYVNEVQKSSHYFALKERSARLRVLDLGGHIGAWGAAWMYCFPQTSLFSLEPNPEPFLLLQKNASFYSGWRVFNFGVGKTSGLADFFYVPQKSGQGSRFPQNADRGLLTREPIKKAQVELKVLDEELCRQEFEGVEFDVIKIDVEGAEWEVVEGIRGLRWRYLFVEVSPNPESARNAAGFVEHVNQLWPNAQRIHSEVHENGVEEFYFMNGERL